MSSSYASHPSRSYAYAAPNTTDYSTSSGASASAPSTGSSSASASAKPASAPAFNRYAQPSPAAKTAAPNSARGGQLRTAATVTRGGSKNNADADAGESGAHMNAVLQAFAVTLALQYASAALAMPFEVAKLLLQVQYLPTPYTKSTDDSGAGASQPHTSKQSRTNPTSDEAHVDGDDDDADSAYAGEARHWGGEFDELSDEDEAVAYFQDLSSQPLRPPTSRRGVPGSVENNRPTDAAGYIDPAAAGTLARSGKGGNDADALRPEWILPPVRDGGVWAMIKTISRSKEGVLGLWKGTFASFLLEAGSGFVQPIFAQVLAFLTRQPSLILSLPPSYSPSPYVSLSIQLASHLFTGLLLSPLDTVRTRLVAQSGLRAHRTYKSTWHAFSRMLHEEGGWRTAYLHPNILIPTVLDYTLRPLLSMGAPLVIERWLGIEATNSPALYAAAELTLGTASLLVSLPIETVRRRLQLQRRAAWGLLPKPVTVPLPQPTRDIPLSPSKGGGGKALHPSSAAASTLAGPVDASASAAGASSSSVARGGGGGGSSGALPPLPSFVPATAVGTSALGIRTSVEVRPVAYAGVIEAMYRIVTEECGRRAHGNPRPASKGKAVAPAAAAAASTSETAVKEEQQTQLQNAIDALSDLGGGLKSLYRGFGLAAAANGVVFLLTVVGGENARSAGGLGGGVGQGSFAGGGWTEI